MASKGQKFNKYDPLIKNEVLEKLNSQGYFVQTPPSDVLLAQAQARMKDSQDKRYD